MGKRRIIPNGRGVDFLNRDVERDVLGTINTPCFYLDGRHFHAPTFWLVVKYPKSAVSRKIAAAALRAFLNAVLDGMPPAARESADFHFWKQITRDIVEGYFYGVLREDASQKATTIKSTRALIQSFYRVAAQRGWCIDDLSYLFDGLNIEEDTELDLHSQYVEGGLYDVLIKQLETWRPDRAAKTASDSLHNERKRFHRSRDRLVMALGYEGGLRANEVSLLDVEKILPALESVKEKSRITHHIKIEFVRKGGRLKELDISQELGQKIYSFICIERKTRLNGVKNPHATDRSGPLICSESGKRLSSKHASNVFNELRERALVSDIPALLNRVEENEAAGHWLAERQISGNGQQKSGLSFHALRHTYLTNLSIEHPGEDDYVKQQAGHAAKTTTFEIYVDFGAKLQALRAKQSASEGIQNA